MKETKHTDIFSPSLCHFLRCENQICTSIHFFLHSKRTVERQKRRRNRRVRIYVRLKVFFSCEKGDKIPGCGLKSALGKAVALALTDQLLSHSLLFLHRHAVQNGYWMAQITLHRLDRIEEQQIQITLK